MPNPQNVHASVRDTLNIGLAAVPAVLVGMLLEKDIMRAAWWADNCALDCRLRAIGLKKRIVCHTFDLLRGSVLDGALSPEPRVYTK